jgi:tryptophanyl-tRNA synthetase
MPNSPLPVVSGMRPTGALHLGHYHGVLANWVALQAQHPCLFFVADWHALTTEYDHVGQLGQHTRQMVIDWLAAGVDPESATIFVQSRVPEHAELHVLLSMITPLSWLERVPTYKDQQEKLTQKDLSTYGFLGYPLLQAADILAYRAGYVPVGEDQVPHIEFTRELARRFNHLYGAAVLTEPQAILTPASRLPGTDGQKMSKSYNNTIALRDDTPTITHKIRTMKTDPARQRRSDCGSPERCPVWSFHQVYTGADIHSWVRAGCEGAGIGCIECKQPVIDAVLGVLTPMRERAQVYEEDVRRVEEIIEAGSEKARQCAGALMRDVRNMMGLSSPVSSVS